jgi:hypothetical protein
LTGLVAVVAVDRSVPVADADLVPLATAYQDLRGGFPAARLAHGDVLRAARMEQGHEAPAGDGGASYLAAGRVHGARPDGAVDLRDADGQFTAVGRDETTGEVWAANDPMGMTALYVALRGDRAYVSTCSLALARLLGAPADRLSLQSFLLSGYHFGTGNHWRGVERLEPGTVLRFTADGVRRDQYWRPNVDEAVRRLPLRDAADHCIEVATSVLRERHAGKETWVDLTGGYDSRLLALLLRRAGVPVRGNTRSTPDGQDLPMARAVAAAMGVPWEAPVLPEGWSDKVTEWLPFALGWGDANLEVLQLARVVWAHDRLRERLPGLLAGGGGEHFQFAPWKSEFHRAGRSSTVTYDNFIGMRMLKPVQRSVLAGDPVGAVREDMRERLSRWVAPYASATNTEQLDLLYAYKSTGHFGAYRSSDDGLLQAELPFYYRPVFEAAFSTDFRHRNGHRLMRAMTARLDPRVAALQTTRGGPAEPVRVTNAHRYWPYYAGLARRAVTKVSEKLTGRPLLLPVEGFPWAADAHRNVLVGLGGGALLRPEQLVSADLYRPDALAQLLQASTQPGFTQSALLGRILTVELALRATGGAVAS